MTKSKANVLNYFVFSSAWRQEKRVPKCSHATPDQIESGAPIELLPFGQLRFAITQLSLPNPTPISTQPLRHDYTVKTNYRYPRLCSLACLRNLNSFVFRVY